MTSSFSVDDKADDLPSTPWRFALYFYHKIRFALIAILTFEAGQAACTMMLPYAIKQIIDGVTLANETGGDVFESAYDGMVLFTLLNIGIVIFSRASGSVLVAYSPGLRAKIRKTLFRYLQFHSHSYFVAHFSGSLANRISEVSLSCMHALWTITFDFYPLIIKSTVALIILFNTTAELAIVLTIWLVIYTFVSIFLARRCQGFSMKFAAARSKVSGKIVDSVTNIMNTKMFARGDYEERYLSNYLDDEVEHALKTYWYMEKMRWFQYVAAMILMVSMISYALSVWAEGELTVGEFSMVAAICIMLIEAARGLSRSFLEFFEYIGNISDGVHIFIQPHDITDIEGAQDLVVTEGKIEFKDIDFSYNGASQLFKQLNVTITPFQKVGLVGFSGSGKSTFVSLLLRLFEANNGKIQIDSQNILEVTQDSLRKSISLIPQEPMLFHRTLMENIRYGNLDATDDEVIEAAKKANAHEFIELTEKGYDSPVGERGVKLSGGQRQRIAIARAILKNASILILDEATSSLDSITEKKIQQGLDHLMKHKTVIIVAHRLSTIAHLDRILVFNDGAIIEDGSHDELLKIHDGHYAHLWAMQAGGFLPEKEAI